jgi:hypothetical protein
MTCEIIRNMPIEDYHGSAPEWLSKTSLRHYREHGPARWHAFHVSKTLTPPKPGGVEMGLALDTWLTEGTTHLYERFVFKPEGMKLSTKDGIAWKAQQEGKTILSAEDELILADCYSAVHACCLWPEIEQAEPQVSLRRYSPGLGFGIQSRPDWLRIDGDKAWIYDLKKTRDLSRFGAQAIDLGYHMQAAIAVWVLAGMGIEVQSATLIAVEEELRARCMCYEIPQAALIDGHMDLQEIAKEIAARMKSGDWTHKQEQPEPLPIPAWQQRRIAKRQEEAQ